MKLRALLLTTFLISSPAFAQTATKPDEAPAKPVEASKADTSTTEPTRPVYSPILPVKIKPRQGGADSMSKAAADIQEENKLNSDSLGLYARASDGGLGETIWKNYTGAKLADDISKINLNFTSPTLWDLLKRAMLTIPDPKSFGEDKTNEAFSARLATLVDTGAFAETVTLYNKLEGNIPSAKAALAGAESMAALGQTGTVCLEEKAISSDLKQNQSTSFWPDLNSFCKILLTTDTPVEDSNAALAKASKLFIESKKLASPASLTELNGKSAIEIIALDNANLLPDSLFSPEKVRTLKPEVIFLLLKHTTAPTSRLSLLAVAAEKGMVERNQFETEFLAQSSAPVTGYWQPYLNAYRTAQSAADETAKVLALKEALKNTASSGDAALIPFARLFAQLKNVDSFTAEEARKVIGLFIRSQTNVSGLWAAKAFNNEELKTKESLTDLDVIGFINADMTAPRHDSQDEGKEKPEAPEKVQKKPESIDNPQLYAISLILQNEEAEDKPSEKSYEKLLSLTGTNDYVMPSNELMNNLKQAATSQDTGKVVLYALQILNGQRISQIHPAALFRISEGLKSVGLSEEYRGLAHEALADLMEYKN